MKLTVPTTGTDGCREVRQKVYVVRQTAERRIDARGVDTDDIGADATVNDLVGNVSASSVPQRNDRLEAGAATDGLQPITVRLQIDVAEDHVGVPLLTQRHQGGKEGSVAIVQPAPARSGDGSRSESQRVELVCCGRGSIFDRGELAFLDHVHRLDAGDRRACAAKVLGPERRSHDALDGPVVLLDQVVEVLGLP